MTKPRKPLDYLQCLKRLADAGTGHSPSPNRDEVDECDENSIEERVQNLLGIVNAENRGYGNMLFFVMYDIEANKTRRYVVKYLERMGCKRIQKSIFLADLPGGKYSQIKEDLAMVQKAYENNDSILVVPISTDLLKSMKIIGQNIDIDLIIKNKNTIFF